MPDPEDGARGDDRQQSEPHLLLQLSELRDLFTTSAEGQEIQPEVAFLRAVVQSIGDAVCVTDPDNRLLYVNDVFRKMYGYSDQELAGQRIDLIVSPREPAGAADEVKHATLQGGWQGERWNRRKDGTEFPVQLSTVPIVDRTGRPVALVGVIAEITGQKRVKKELRECEEAYRTLFEQGPFAVWLTDIDGRVVDVNETVCALTGWSLPEVLGKTALELGLIGLEQQTAMREALRNSGVLSQYEATFQIGKEVRKDALVSAKTINLEGVPHVLWIVNDITAHKRAEEQRRKLEEQLMQARKLESVGRLAGGVAHDFNNLLTVINGYTSLLLGRSTGNDGARHMLEEIRKAGDRAAVLVSQLLAFSRKQILRPRALDINQVVSDVEKMLVRLIGEDVELTTYLAALPEAIFVDPHQLEQVIVNLAVNARDAMPQGGRLIIETARVELEGPCAHCSAAVPPGSYMRLSMSDTGRGMDEEVRTHLFEPFFTTKEVGAGSGLGLSTVHGIVVQSGGHIDVVSAPGVGTTFHIYFPTTAANSGRDEETEGPGLPQGKETILLVEDEEDVRGVLAAALEECGYRVLPAAGGREAMRISTQEPGPIHLLLVDVVMPGTSGWELAASLRERWPAVKTLYMSGYMDHRTERHGVSSGRTFIQKPFSNEALAAKVREVLDEI